MEINIVLILIQMASVSIVIDCTSLILMENANLEILSVWSILMATVPIAVLTISLKGESACLTWPAANNRKDMNSAKSVKITTSLREETVLPK